MHPAYSVIFFTTASGAGYGLLFWLGLGEMLGALPESRWMGFVGMVVSLGLITAGLLSSLLHLGHPERFLGSFSQWRSSWLSREGVAAVATYVPSGLLALCWMFGLETGLTAILGLLSALGAVITVYCTGMIYASLRTIRQWDQPLVRWVYLALAAGTGGVLAALLFAVFGFAPWWVILVGIVSMAVAWLLKAAYWMAIDVDPGKYTAEMALGLKGWSQVKTLEPPHTRPNFVMREMGYSVGRKHVWKLRKAAWALLFLVPLVLMVMSWTVGGSAIALLLAALSAGAGVLTERWLFFAEAEHVSMLYYGAERA